MEEQRPVEAETAGWSRGQRIGVILGVLVSAGIVALLIVGLARPDQEFSIDRNIAENKAPFLPEITLPVLVAGPGVGPEGARVSLSSLRGKPVVLNLWASWCDPCRNEAPILDRLAKRYQPRGVTFIGVNVRDLTDDAKAFIDEFHLPFASLRDGSDRTERILETTGVPETFIIDPDGKMRIVPFRGELTSASERDIGAYLDTVLAR